MAQKLNPARGEVAFAAAGQSFRLVASAENLAALEVQSGAYGFREIVRRLDARSLHTIRQALICMDASAADPVEATRKVGALGIADLFAAGAAVARAVVFELQGDPEKKDAGAEAKTS